MANESIKEDKKRNEPLYLSSRYLEVKQNESIDDSIFYYVKYPISSKEGEHIDIGTFQNEFLDYTSQRRSLSIYENMLIQINNSMDSYHKTNIVQVKQLLESNTKFLLDRMEHYDKKNVDAHSEIINIEEQINQKLKILLKENSDLRNLLDEKYSAKTLLLISTSSSAALGFSIFAWYTLNLPLIHPVLSIPFIIASIGFSFLSYWRLK